MKAIFLFLVFIFNITLSLSDSGKQNQISSITLDGDSLIKEVPKSINRAKNISYDFVDNDKMIKDTGSISRESALAKQSKLKDNKISKVSSNVLYLQSIYYIDKNNWRLKINNVNISREDGFNISNMVSIDYVDHNFVKFRLLNPNDIMAKGSKDLVLQKGDYYAFALRVNEYFDFNEYKVQSGNILEKYKKRKDLVQVSYR